MDLLIVAGIVLVALGCMAWIAMLPDNHSWKLSEPRMPEIERDALDAAIERYNQEQARQGVR